MRLFEWFSTTVDLYNVVPFALEIIPYHWDDRNDPG